MLSTAPCCAAAVLFGRRRGARASRAADTRVAAVEGDGEGESEAGGGVSVEEATLTGAELRALVVEKVRACVAVAVGRAGTRHSVCSISFPYTILAHVPPVGAQLRHATVSAERQVQREEGTRHHERGSSTSHCPPQRCIYKSCGRSVVTCYSQRVDVRPVCGPTQLPDDRRAIHRAAGRGR